jgi:hypothetical protein
MPAEPLYVRNMAPALMTVEELLYTSVPDKRVALVRGVLVVREPPGLRHGRVTMELGRRLADHIDTHALGRVYAESGFKLASQPDTVRGPISRSSAAHDSPILSHGLPGPRPRSCHRDRLARRSSREYWPKVADWLSAGAGLVWVVDPQRRLARVYRLDGTEQIVTAEQVLDGEDVVPGFSAPR